LGIYRLIIVISFLYIASFINEMTFFVSFDKCKFEIYFVWYKYATPACFQGPLAW
jgi:hypothetical protein